MATIMAGFQPIGDRHELVWASPDFSGVVCPNKRFVA